MVLYLLRLKKQIISAIILDVHTYVHTSFPYGNYSRCQFFRSNEDFQPIYLKTKLNFFLCSREKCRFFNEWIHTYLLQLIASLKPSDMNFLYKAKLIQLANFTRQPSSLFICRQYSSNKIKKTQNEQLNIVCQNLNSQ